MEADDSNPFCRELSDIAAGREQADPHLDFELINPGHAWKTNREDLAATFYSCGFRDIRMFTRAAYPSFYQPPMHVSRIRRLRVVGRVLERLILRTFRRGLRRVYPGEMPYIVVRAYYTIAGRCWFSRLRLIHGLTHEVVVLATAGEAAQADGRARRWTVSR